MLTYIFKGSLTRHGVTFYIDAKTPEEAKALAQAGKYDNYDLLASETVDWEIWPETMMVNE